MRRAHTHTHIHTHAHTYTYTHTHTRTHRHTHTHTHTHTYTHAHAHIQESLNMVGLRFVGFLTLQVSFAKEPYERDDIPQKRPII